MMMHTVARGGVRRVSARGSVCRAALLGAALMLAAAFGGEARATLVNGGYANAALDGLVPTTVSASVLGATREMFFNNLDRLDAVQIEVAGPMLQTHDNLTIRILD